MVDMNVQAETSCFVNRLQYYAELTGPEKQLLAEFERSERLLEKDQHLYREGDPATELFVVKRGWLCNYRFTEKGQRQILELRHPGDLLGVEGLMLSTRDASLMALEESVVCPLPKKAMLQLMECAPRVAMLIQAMASLDHVVLIDQMQVIARSSAADRILHLFLHLLHRLRMTNPHIADTFRLPMTQIQVGDLLGLTNVTVSRTMTELERDGYILREKGSIRFLLPDAAAARIGFINRFAGIDVSWLRQG